MVHTSKNSKMPNNKMPCWYYEKKDLRQTPSFVNGIDPEVEARYRREGARFIINTGTKMGLRYDTMATGVVYFHRFYMFHSFRDFPRYVTACCCLFLAGKVEETPKKCKDIIKTARGLLSDHQFAQFGDDPKEEVMTLERILLQTIKFDLQVDHPYGYLLKYAKCLKGDKQKLQKMVQMAWTFVNDSLCTSLCLQWEPEIIAIALMYLAGKLSKFEVNDWNGRQAKHARWWDMYVDDISMELLEDICHQVLDLYSSHPSTTKTDSPPNTPPGQMPGRIHAAAVAMLAGQAQMQLGLPGTSGMPRSNSPAQPPPTNTNIAVQISKPSKTEHATPATGKPIPVTDHKSTVVPNVNKSHHHSVPQNIPVVAESVVAHSVTQPPLPPTPTGYAYASQTDSFGQYSSPVPPPPSYQAVHNYQTASYASSESTVQSQVAQYDSNTAQYAQPPPPPQHYSANYDPQTYAAYQGSAQSYYQPQAGYPPPTPPTTYVPPLPPVTQYQETFNNPPPQFPTGGTPTYPASTPHSAYPPPNSPYGLNPSYVPPRAGPPPVQQKRPQPAPTGNIAPVRITGRSNRQSWNM